MSHIHIVISTKELQNSDELLNWLDNNTNNYILSLENGTTGHEHLECFAELPKSRRVDSIKRSILELYPKIPKEEQKNIKIVQNKIDPNPLYGYGYALKEGKLIASTFDDFFHADALEYYEKHREHVKTTLEKVTARFKGLTLDDIGDGCVEFFKKYYGDKKIDSGMSTSRWLIEEYLKSIKTKIKFQLFQKINVEKLQEFLTIQLVDGLLDCPHHHTTPP